MQTYKTKTLTHGNPNYPLPIKRILGLVKLWNHLKQLDSIV